MRYYKSLYGSIQRSYGIIQNKEKIDLLLFVVCISCVFMAFGGVSERF